MQIKNRSLYTPIDSGSFSSSEEVGANFNEGLPLFSVEKKSLVLSLVCRYLYENYLFNRSREDQSIEALKIFLSARCVNRDTFNRENPYTYNFILDNVITSLMERSVHLLKSYIRKRAEFESYSFKNSLVLSERFLTECLENINYTIRYLSDRQQLEKAEEVENILTSELPFFEHALDQLPITQQSIFDKWKHPINGGTHKAFVAVMCGLMLISFIPLFLHSDGVSGKDHGNYSSAESGYESEFDAKGWIMFFSLSIPVITALAIYFYCNCPAPYAIESDFFDQLDACIEKPKDEQAPFLLYVLENMSKILIQQGYGEEIDARLEEMISNLRRDVGSEVLDSEQVSIMMEEPNFDSEASLSM